MGFMQDAPIEYEVKFFPVDHNEIRSKLKKLNATIKTPERLMRRAVFSHRDNAELQCHYIRVRHEGDKVTMSAKFHTPGNGAESWREIETTVSDFEATKRIIEYTGLISKGEQQNKRETWQMPDGTLVELETWPNLPPYLEIEGSSAAAVQLVAKQLDLDWEDHISDANSVLYARHLGVSEEEIYKNPPKLIFETE